MANNLEEAEIFALQGLKESQGKADRGLEEYALALLNYLWIGNENHQAAIQFFSHYLLAHLTDAVAHHLRGIHFWYGGNPEEALRDCNLVRTPSNSVFPLMGRGQILVELGNPKDAIRDLEKVLQTINATPNARDKYEKKNDYGKALSDYRKSLSRVESKLPPYKRKLAEERVKELSEEDSR